jgi:hypothetical protein
MTHVPAEPHLPPSLLTTPCCCSCGRRGWRRRACASMASCTKRSPSSLAGRRSSPHLLSFHPISSPLLSSPLLSSSSPLLPSHQATRHTLLLLLHSPRRSELLLRRAVACWLEWMGEMRERKQRLIGGVIFRVVHRYQTRIEPHHPGPISSLHHPWSPIILWPRHPWSLIILWQAPHHVLGHVARPPRRGGLAAHRRLPLALRRPVTRMEPMEGGALSDLPTHAPRAYPHRPLP